MVLVRDGAHDLDDLFALCTDADEAFSPLHFLHFSPPGESIITQRGSVVKSFFPLAFLYPLRFPVMRFWSRVAAVGALFSIFSIWL